MWGALGADAAGGEQVCFPDGVIPDDVEVSPLEAINIDMTPLPAKESVFVDFSKKGYD